jgi:hypothetical protein
MFPNNPELNHNTLDQMHNGEEASSAYMALSSLDPQEQERTKAALLAYCRLDTYAMVKIIQKLHCLNTSLEE